MSGDSARRVLGPSARSPGSGCSAGSETNGCSIWKDRLPVMKCSNRLSHLAVHHVMADLHVLDDLCGREPDRACQPCRRRGRLGGNRPYAAACRVISEISVRLWPSVVPNLAIQTRTLDVLVRSCTSTRLCPGCSGVVGVSSRVSANVAGVSVGEERIWNSVPVLDKS